MCPFLSKKGKVASLPVSHCLLRAAAEMVMLRHRAASWTVKCIKLNIVHLTYPSLLRCKKKIHYCPLQEKKNYIISIILSSFQNSDILFIDLYWSYWPITSQNNNKQLISRPLPVQLFAFWECNFFFDWPKFCQDYPNSLHYPLMN